MYQYPWDEGERFQGYLLSAAQKIDLPQVRIPVLAVIGEFDYPNHWTHRMKRELPSFKLVLLPDRGHLRSLRSPKYNEAVVRFIEDNDLR